MKHMTVVHNNYKIQTIGEIVAISNLKNKPFICCYFVIYKSSKDKQFVCANKVRLTTTCVAKVPFGIMQAQ